MENGQCDAQYSIDGGDFTNGCAIAALPSGRHTVTIRPGDGVQTLQFFGIDGMVPAGSGDGS